MNFLLLPRPFSPLAVLAVAALLFSAHPSSAGDCCSAPEPDKVVASVAVYRLPLAAKPAAPWMYQSLAAGRSLGVAGGSRQFNYMIEHHLWLMGGLQTVPTGLPLTAETSNADRASFSQAGLGLGYMLSPAVRAVTNWKTGLGQHSVSPGSQFTVGVALRY